MEPGTTGLRWMWIWITLCALVVIVVIGFLFGITSSLDSIDGGLEEANTAVSGAGGDVKPLPSHIESINKSLTEIDRATEPIAIQAREIINETDSIDRNLVITNNSLTDTDNRLETTLGSLEQTSGTLVGVAGSLAGTTAPTLQEVSGRLVTILALANRIEGTLIRAQTPASEGTEAIWRRVRFLNGGRFRAGGNVNTKGLRFVEQDADQILGGLREVNKHLTSICSQLPAGSGGETRC